MHSTAAQVRPAVRRRPETSVTILLCDSVLPDSSGIQLAEILRRRSADLKVVLVSGYPRATLPGDLDQKTGDEFLAKPYCATSLVAKVRMVLQKEGSTRS